MSMIAPSSLRTTQPAPIHILTNVDTDCTKEFHAIDSDKAKALLDTYCIECIDELIATGTGFMLS
jgi:hypothetical protein